jgi:hypothetical protein
VDQLLAFVDVLKTQLAAYRAPLAELTSSINEGDD